MATGKSGNLIKLYLRENGSTAAYKYVVCNEDLSLEGSADEVSRPTKCGTLKTAGTPSYSISFSGVANFANDASQISHNELADWFAAQTLLDFVFGDAPTGATVLDFNGVCTLTSFNITATVDDFISFDATLGVNGTPTNNI